MRKIYILDEQDWIKIAKEYGEKGPTKLAKELGVSKQRIHQIACKLRDNGVDIPKFHI